MTFRKMSGYSKTNLKLKVKNGHIRRVSDDKVRSLVLEITGTNVATTYIYCPADPKISLGIRHSFLIMTIKSLNKYFSFEITVHFNLADFTRRAYGTDYVETVRIQIHANCRIRRVYFADRLYSEDEVPSGYRLLADEPRRSDHGMRMTSGALTALAQCPGVPPPGQCGGDFNPQRNEKPIRDPTDVQQVEGDSQWGTTL